MKGSCDTPEINFIEGPLYARHCVRLEFRDADTIHSSQQLQIRQEKIRAWTNAVEMRKVGEV